MEKNKIQLILVLTMFLRKLSKLFLLYVEYITYRGKKLVFVNSKIFHYTQYGEIKPVIH